MHKYLLVNFMRLFKITGLIPIFNTLSKMNIESVEEKPWAFGLRLLLTFLV